MANGYKNILLIDDVIRMGENARNGYTGWFSDCNNIDIIGTFYEACTAIIDKENMNKYDLVFFDMNMEYAFPDDYDDKENEINTIFKERNIIINYENLLNKDKHTINQSMN